MLKWISAFLRSIDQMDLEGIDHIRHFVIIHMGYHIICHISQISVFYLSAT